MRRRIDRRNHLAARGKHSRPRTGAAPLPKEIRAEKFVIVDENGSPRGAFGVRDKDGWPILEVIDKKGNAWAARMAGEGFFRNGKPSVVPAK